MEARLDVVTLGVNDLNRSIEFYRDLLGFPVELEDENYIRFETGASKLALFPRDLLAADADVSATGNGFSGITLAQVVDSKEAIDAILEQVREAGGTVSRPTHEAEWFAGYSGYFADPDGYLWEVVAFTG